MNWKLKPLGSWWSSIVHWAKNIPWVKVIIGMVIGQLALIIFSILLQ